MYEKRKTNTVVRQRLKKEGIQNKPDSMEKDKAGGGHSALGEFQDSHTINWLLNGGETGIVSIAPSFIPV